MKVSMREGFGGGGGGGAARRMCTINVSRSLRSPRRARRAARAKIVLHRGVTNGVAIMASTGTITKLVTAPMRPVIDTVVLWGG